ncbi:hypothetical protein [Methylobacterium radiotolerans]|uniref:hypothetical protein n=1 Tax=Methylobacterium radiotolerans TaxID=31998 RepID=UPI001F425EA2|nr:hypothetical protein [Methylobacterium radiotolerans]UIY43385.1 hypothetical protein LZ599_06630 [Methylobacterium radiotolerans]
MKAIRAIARELIGLVVDDVGFAAAILGWLALVWVLATLAPQLAPWVAILLFCGLAAILVESVLRRSGATR